MVPTLSWASSGPIVVIAGVAALMLGGAAAAGAVRRRRGLAAAGAVVMLLAGCTSADDAESAATASEASSADPSEMELGEPPKLEDATRTNPRHFTPVLDPEEPPAQMPPLDVTSRDGVHPGAVAFTTYTTPRMTPDQAYHPSFVIELDKQSGELRKVQQMLTAATMFQPEPGGRYSYNIVDKEGEAGAGIEVTHYLTDDELNMLAKYDLDDLEGGDADLHDFELLDNGNAMLLAYRKREADLSEFGGPADGLVWDTVIAERTADGETVWLWDGAEHMDLADVPDAVAEAQFVESPPSGAADYAHPNSLEIADDGDVLVSIRHYDCTLRIDRETSEVEWSFGGPNCVENDFEISGDPLGGPSHQHDATITDDGNLLIFDNGNLRTDDDQISRVVEYAIDEEAMTAELVWSYDDDRYTPIMGSAERLDNGNTLIGWGQLTAPAITEVTPDGEKVFEVSLPEGQLVYRAYQGAAR